MKNKILGYRLNQIHSVKYYWNTTKIYIIKRVYWKEERVLIYDHQKGAESAVIVPISEILDVNLKA